MANYTMEIRQMVNEPLIGLFTFDYDFYSDNIKDKEQFEKLFVEYFYFREIGFETPERFKVKLKAKLDLIMPYYRQLALTAWNKVRTVEQMMTSKNLKETTTHEQTINGDNESSQNSLSNVSQNSEVSNSSTSSGNTSSSNLSDGVSSVSLNDGYLTSKTSELQNIEQSSTQTGSQNTTNSDTLKSKSNQILSESTTFHSTGDIGIQTPSYAITEWRKVIINLNQMILNECEELFMKIY